MTFAIAYPGQFDPADRRKVEASFGIWLRGANIPLAVGRQIIDAQNQALGELGQELQLPVADIAGSVPPDARHFVDVAHLTAEGNRRIAEALARTLIPLIDRLRE